jgi:tyrosyl-tRNA synthetase
MLTAQSSFLSAATKRGFVDEYTEGLDERLSEGPVAAYIGYDCTADSLHVGSLVGIMLLRLLQKYGHKPIVLMGGGTSRIGDPSGKDEARPLLDDAEIARNMAGIRKIFAQFINFGDGPSDAIMVNNADWLDGLRYIPLLRDVWRHFSVNRMLDQDSVKLRLERDQPLSFLEFNYLILQAYDFVELARRFGCELQIGGSDQWGNILGGVDLARRLDGRRLFGLTTPLITTASGTKMGKSAQGAVWLNPEKLPHYEYIQFWRNTDDADVGTFLRLFTELPIEEIVELERGEINAAKERLAFEATSLCRGPEAAKAAAAMAHAFFLQPRHPTGRHQGTERSRRAGVLESGSLSEPWAPLGVIPAQGVPDQRAPALDPGVREPDGGSGSSQIEGVVAIAAAAGTLREISRDLLARGITAFELFTRVGLATSNSEARRLIRGGGARINDTVVESETRPVSLADLDENDVLKLSAGRKRHVLVRPV